MRIQTDCCDPGRRSDTLVVLLPPALASIDDFVSKGFVDVLRQRRLAVDLLLADIHGQHVLDRAVVSLLHHQVLGPARSLGYKKVWLVGVSLGAYSALLYAAKHAQAIDSFLAGLFLISPYPGTNDVQAQIRAAESPSAWIQQQSASHDEYDECGWWRWLIRENTPTEGAVSVYLGIGTQDRFRRGQTLIGGLLPPQRVCVLPGAHDWPTWKALWIHWLDYGPLRSLSGVGAQGADIQSETVFGFNFWGTEW